MRTSLKLSRALLALFVLAALSTFALAADPGLLVPPTSEASDQKAGSILFYNTYTSGATSGNTQNTRINITKPASLRRRLFTFTSLLKAARSLTATSA